MRLAQFRTLATIALVAMLLPAPASAQTEDDRGGKARIHGRCVDEQAGPIAGATISFLPIDSGSGRGSERRMPRLPDPATSAADGGFDITLHPSIQGPLALSLEAAGRVSATYLIETLRQGQALDLGDLRLLRGCVAKLRLVDSEGRPQAGQMLALKAKHAAPAPPGPDGRLPMFHANGRTDADGRAVLNTALSPGSWIIAVPQRDMLSKPEIVVAEDAATIEVEVVVEAFPESDCIAGRVVDQSGRPVAGVRVIALLSGNRAGMVSQTDADGKFRGRRHQSLPEEAPLIQVSGPDIHELTTEAAHPWGSLDIRIEVERRPLIELRVVDAVSGDVIEDFEVRSWRAAEEIPERIAVQGAKLIPQADGSARFYLWFGEPGQLTVNDKAGLCLPSAITSFIPSTTELTRVTVALERRASRRLRVLHSDGSPAVRAGVSLIEAFAGQVIDVKTKVGGIHALLTKPERWHGVTWSRGMTDERGEVSLSGPPGVPLVIRVTGRELRPFVHPGLILDEGEGTIDIRAVAGATLSGRIGPPALLEQIRRLTSTGRTTQRFPRVRLVRYEGEGADQGLPALTRERPRPAARFPRSSDGIELDAEGRFHFRDAPSGDWNLELLSWGTTTGLQILHFEALGALQAGESRQLDLDLPQLVRSRLRGVVRIDDELCKDTRIQFFPDLGPGIRPDGGEGIEVMTDAEGRVEAPLAPGRYRLFVRWGGQGRDRRSTFLSDELYTAPTPDGEELDLHIQTGRLLLRVVGSDGKPRSGVPIALAGPAIDRHTQLQISDDEGRISVRLTGGVVGLSTIPKQLAGPEGQRRFLEEHGGDRHALKALEIPLGEERVITGRNKHETELRLPDRAGY